MGPCQAVLPPTPGTPAELLTWGHWDNTVRLCAAESGETAGVASQALALGDAVTAAHLTPAGDCFACGSAHGVVLVWRRPSPLKHLLSHTPVRLFGHDAAVRAVAVCPAQATVATGADDATCILWDLNRLAYRLTLPHAAPVVAVAVQAHNGTVYTLEALAHPPHATRLNAWSLNGALLGTVGCARRAACLAVSLNPEGIDTNVVALGNDDGTITLHDATTLQLVNTLDSRTGVPVTALAFSFVVSFPFSFFFSFFRFSLLFFFTIFSLHRHDNQHIYAGYESGQVVDWSRSPY